MLQLLLGPAVELAKDFVKGKVEEKKAVQQARISKIQNDANWEASMADATKSSWKDEWFTIVLSMPLLGIGYGVAVDDSSVIERVNRAFEVLAQTPDFYQQMLFIAVLASFGIKGAGKVMDLAKKR